MDELTENTSKIPKTDVTDVDDDKSENSEIFNSDEIIDLTNYEISLANQTIVDNNLIKERLEKLEKVVFNHETFIKKVLGLDLFQIEKK